MERGKIIFLNGVSSAGKSTLASEIIKLEPDYFHFSFDDFDLVIEKMEDRQNGHLIPVPTEYFFHRSIAMFSEKGVNLIVDHVLHDRLTAEDCFGTLHNYNVLFVGVHCPIEELQRREIARGDRTVGQAVSQLGYVHTNEIYDLEVDTFRETVKSCAERIVKCLHRDGDRTGWQQTVSRCYTCTPSK